MKHTTLHYDRLPVTFTEALNSPDSLVYLEQTRAKEYSAQIDPLPGQRTILLPWSGGLDSTSALLMALEGGLPVRTVYTSYGHPYDTGEQTSVARLQKTILESYPEAARLWLEHMQLNLGDVAAEGLSRMGGEWRHLFPLRNYLILTETMAQNDGDSELWFCPVKGEMPYSGGDKSLVFVRHMQGLASEAGLALFLPLVGLSKSDLVGWGTLSPARYAVLRQTLSCFGSSGHCGTCQACFTRAVAFHAVGRLEDSGVPTDGVGLAEIVLYYREKIAEGGHYPASRTAEMQAFIAHLEQLHD